MHKHSVGSKEGSSIIFVMSIMAVITACFMGVLYTTLCAWELVTMRETLAHRERATHGVLHYAIEYAAAHYAVLHTYISTDNRTIELIFDHLPGENKEEYSGRAVISSLSDSIMIQATVHHKTELFGSMRCQLAALDNKKDTPNRPNQQGARAFVISGWSSD